MAATVAAAQPDLLEVNISCPTCTATSANPTPAAPARYRVMQGQSCALRDKGIPVIVKLAPNVPSIGRIARGGRSRGPARCASSIPCRDLSSTPKTGARRAKSQRRAERTGNQSPSR